MKRSLILVKSTVLKVDLMAATAITFLPGHRIRVHVTSRANFRAMSAI